MSTRRGLLVSIYGPRDGGNCSNGGISLRHTKAILTGEGIAEIFQPTDSAPEVQLMPALGGGVGYRAVPAAVSDRWSMFGGCFIYSSDSRFPADQPIALHDRVESAEEMARFD